MAEEVSSASRDLWAVDVAEAPGVRNGLDVLGAPEVP